MKTYFLPKSSRQLSQFIDSEAVFTALEEARGALKPYAGTMFWREVNGQKYLIRAVTPGSQRSLGPMSPENSGMVEKFQEKKSVAELRVKTLAAELNTHQKINKALRVGRVPDVVVNTLNAIRDAGLEDKFLVIGTHALHAYETAAGVMISSNLMATQDIDLLLDTRKKVEFFAQMDRLDSSFLGILQKADKTFRMRDGQLYTAVNSTGFEVDVVRRFAGDMDPHPLKLSNFENDFWAVQIQTGERLLGARPFKQIVVSANGVMARMNTVHPLDFARIKKTLGEKIRKNEPMKAAKDIEQADSVVLLVEEHLPHLMDARKHEAFPDSLPAVANGVEVVTDGRFIGAVKEVSGQFVVQDAGRGRLVAHECHRFDALPAVGDSIDLQHRGGKVVFSVVKGKGRAVDVGR